MANREGNAGDRSGTDGAPVNETVLDASGWFARMRAPGAEQYRAEFEAWRRVPANATAYARTEENWLLLAGIAPAHLAAHAPTPANRSRGRWALAAALILAISLGAAWVTLGPSKHSVVVAAHEASVTKLDDGTTVELFGGAHVTPRFTPGERRVLLTGGGRARFTVAHDAARPFRVEAEGSETTALGTIFEIDLSKPLPVVHLVRGSVEVRVLASGTAPVRLRPGQYAEAAQAGARLIASTPAGKPDLPKMEVPVAAPAAADASPPTLLVADNLPLAAVLQYANARSTVPMRLADPALGSRPVTGRFDVADGRALARKLAVALDLALAEDGGTLILGPPKRKN